MAASRSLRCGDTELCRSSASVIAVSPRDDHRNPVRVGLTDVPFSNLTVVIFISKQELVIWIELQAADNISNRVVANKNAVWDCVVNMNFWDWKHF